MIRQESSFAFSHSVGRKQSTQLCDKHSARYVNHTICVRVHLMFEKHAVTRKVLTSSGELSSAAASQSAGQRVVRIDGCKNEVTREGAGRELSLSPSGLHYGS
jgi:hypothetical protein